MALPTPTISYQDGTANAAVNLANNATAYVTSGNFLSIALQSTTGIVQASWTVLVQGLPIATTQSYQWTPGTTPAGFTIALPPQPCTILVLTSVTDGNNASYAQNTFVSTPQALASGGVVHRARGVVTAAETLATFDSVTGGTIRDGVTYVQGDVVLLVGQATKSQNGLYVVGAVAAGSAPLTRAADYATGTVFAKGSPVVVEVGPDGTLFGNTLWKSTASGPVTVDTTSVDFYPRQVTQSVTLVAGTVTVTNVPILSATKSNFLASRTTANTSTATTGGYQPVGAVTPGIVGTASLVFDATVAAGTINNADISTLSLTIVNF
jgi:hypothetical protein